MQTSLIVQRQVVADASISRVSLRRILGAYELVLLIDVTPNPLRERVWWFRPQSVRVKVIGSPDCELGIAPPEQVEVTSTPVRYRRPEREQHCAFQNDVVAVTGLREAINQPLNGEAEHHELGILVTLARIVRQARAYRCPDIFQGWPRHGMFSR
jgi:hypothetical protein